MGPTASALQSRTEGHSEMGLWAQAELVRCSILTLTPALGHGSPVG